MKKDGQETRLLLTGEAVDLLRGLKNLDAAKLPEVVRSARKVLRFFANTLTSWNPGFIVPNLVRDFQTAALNLTGEGKTKIAAALTKSLRPGVNNSLYKAVSGIGEVLRDRVSTPAGIRAKEFFDAGGVMQSFGSETSLEINKDISKRIARGQIREGLAALENGMENLNKRIENATRLVVYNAARDTGSSIAEAAALAKGVTVNFDRKGTWSPGLNALYLFFNASVQGNARIAASLLKPGGRGNQVMLSLVALGFLTDMLGHAMSGDDDDDGRNDWDQKPDYVKDTNIVIPLGGGRDVRLPSPYGFNLFLNTGRHLSEFARGRKTAGEVASGALVNLARTLNPLGTTPGLFERGTITQTMAPTLLKPIAEASNNRDWKGQPIYPELTWDKAGTPPSQTATREASTISKSIAEGVNALTGGDAVTPGVVSVFPDIIDHFAGWALGGVGKEFGRAVDTASKLLGGEELSANDIPVVRRFVGSNPKGGNLQDFREIGTKIDELHARVKKYNTLGEREKAQALQKDPLYRLEGRWKMARKGIDSIQKQLAQAKTPEARKEIQQKLDKLIAANIRVYVDTTGELR